MKTQNLKILFRIFFLLIFSNCYFNPLVQPIVNPEVKEETNPFLALLGLGGGTNFFITGQIRDPNGVALEGLILVPSPTLIQAKSTLPPYTTDVGGRFYIPYQTGNFTFTVIRNGLSFFVLTLNVSSPSQITSATSNAPPGLEVLNLGAINANEPPNFFELVKVYILDGQMNEIPLHNTNLYTSLGSIHLTFNEPPAFVDSGDISWIQNSLIITPTPTVGYLALTISDNRISLVGAEGFTFNTEFTINFTENIKSASGKSLTPRRAKFCYEPSVSCVFF